MGVSERGVYKREGETERARGRERERERERARERERVCVRGWMGARVRARVK